MSENVVDMDKARKGHAEQQKLPQQLYLEFYAAYSPDNLGEADRRRYTTLLRNRVLEFENGDKSTHLIAYEPTFAQSLSHFRRSDKQGGYEVYNYDRQGFVAFTSDGKSGPRTWFAEEVQKTWRDNVAQPEITIGFVTETGERAHLQINAAGASMSFEQTGLRASVLDEVTSDELRRKALFPPETAQHLGELAAGA